MADNQKKQEHRVFFVQGNGEEHGINSFLNGNEGWIVQAVFGTNAPFLVVLTTLPERPTVEQLFAGEYPLPPVEN